MKFAALALIISSLIPIGVHAQETDVVQRLSLELNTAETVEGACKLTFVVTNGHAQAVDQAVFEAVLFDANAQVKVITLFDFGTLPPALPRVRQFMIPQVICSDLGRVLINGASTCSGAGLPDAACSDGLTITTRTSIEVIG
jgi:hypothetical protein